LDHHTPFFTSCPRMALAGCDRFTCGFRELGTKNAEQMSREKMVLSRFRRKNGAFQISNGISWHFEWV